MSFHFRVLLVTWLLLFTCCDSTFAQRELKDIPDPDPELERKTFIVPDGFEVNLWAADPLMAKPIQMNFDERGRLWVASSEVYPQIKPGQIANDKILVLEDTNHDGQADKTTIFADGLLIPTGVIAGDGGAYVVNSTELLHLKDTNGDGKADQSRVVLSGFGTEDTHHLLHTLRWGPDGCLYMNQSIYIHSHVETPHGVKRLNGGGIWRFRPETMELDVHCYGFVNSWGHHVDAWGQSFATDGAYGEGINYVFPGSVFFTAVGAKRIVAGLNPGSPKHCSLEIVGGGHLPDDWQGNMITNDFRAHRVCRFVVTEDGSGYASRQEVEVIKSNHVAFRPIDVKMGPDGAIYIADWYNPIIQHGEVDFRDERRDHVHGRIWRVSAKGRPTTKLPQLAGASIEQLLELLKSREEWVRQQAKLQLKSHDKGAVVAALKLWLTKLDPSDSQVEHHRLEALWTHEAIDFVNSQLLVALSQSKDHRVRAAAIRTAAHWYSRQPETALLFRSAVIDEHPRVRLEGVRGLALVPTKEAAATAALALNQPVDRFLDFALWQTMRDLEPHWLPAVRDGQITFNGNMEHLLFALQAVESPGIVEPLLNLIRDNKVEANRVDSVLTLIASLGGPKELSAILQMVLDAKSSLPPATKASLLNGLIETTLRRRVQPDGDLLRIAPLLGPTVDEGLRATAVRAVGAWKLTGLRTQLAALATAADNDATVSRRMRDSALDGLTLFGGPESEVVFKQLAAAGRSYENRQRAVSALAVLNPKEAASAAVGLLAELPAGAAPGDVIAALLSQKDGPAILTSALSEKSLKPDIAKLLLRAVQNSPTPSPELIAAIQKAGGLADAGWKLTPELMQQLLAEVATKGNGQRGEAIYRRQQLNCTKCHSIAGAGGRVGPDLVSIGASAQPDYLVDSLIEPNKKVKENYHSKLIVTDAGKVLTGIPVRESGGELVLRDAEDREVSIPVASIEEKKDGRSLMPDGSVDSLTRDELVDLLRFLSELGKVGGQFAVGSAPVVRTWQTLLWTKEAHQRLNRTSFDTAASNDPALTWASVYSTVAGELPLDDLPSLKPHVATTPPTTFVRAQLEVTTPGPVTLKFGSADGVALWLDGKPMRLTDDPTVALTTGIHVLTMGINRETRTAPLRLELAIPTSAATKGQWIGGK